MDSLVVFLFFLSLTFLLSYFLINLFLAALYESFQNPRAIETY